ncbi:histidine triad nucleotide-binding protein [Pajaroellobacter abortibovis]|uniref:Histidine triad nucleotide-binding protein n=1 Tax=Pajaroellobacter abortibovis TaxID=1882918 RepID=A0A1L6MVX4_9BACT|nr:histidine triad nucleotide-binding protein [Pajaroellobacter abortibovis]APR99565.1 histidine triad nucleotide-binding protein [Pajaroellobacter abortibovis]
MRDCLFCKIAHRFIPARIVAENEYALAFHDVRPVAPHHVLVIPKKHISFLGDAAIEDRELLGQLLLMSKEVAVAQQIHETGYRVVINQGENACQSVFHLHLHIMGGRTFAWPPG